MGRKKGPDKRKIALILSVLVRNPDGIWLRKLAEEAKISPSTTSNYIDKTLKDLVEDISLGDYEKPLIRIIKLKSFVLERLHQGDSLDKVLKILRLMDKSEENVS